MSSGIIIQRNRAASLLVTLTSPEWYDSLSPEDKATVDDIDARDPDTRTQEDVNALLRILNETNGC